MKVAFTLLVCCTVHLFGAIPTYFHYSKEATEALQEGRSRFTMDDEKLKWWDMIAARATGELSYFEAERVTTYLYVAQAEASALSHNATGSFAGSLDPVSDGVLKLMVPGYRSPPNMVTDAYSEALKAAVWPKIEARVKEEDSRPGQHPVPKEHQSTYTVGLTTARWIPWHLQNARQYWPDPPPPKNSRQWEKEVRQIKKHQARMDGQARESIYKWGGRRGAHAGNWITIANHYIFSHDVPFGKAVETRAALLTGLYDSAIVFFAAKYHYMVQRPQAYDESVHYEIEVPAHPSYPSGHSTEAGAAAAILSYYLPANQTEWEQLAEESCLSRVYGGIHYPTDDNAGRRSGEKIGRQVIRNGKGR